VYDVPVTKYYSIKKMTAIGNLSKVAERLDRALLKIPFVQFNICQDSKIFSLAGYFGCLSYTHGTAWRTNESFVFYEGLVAVTRDKSSVCFLWCH